MDSDGNGSNDNSNGSAKETNDGASRGTTKEANSGAGLAKVAIKLLFELGEAAANVIEVVRV